MKNEKSRIAQEFHHQQTLLSGVNFDDALIAGLIRSKTRRYHGKGISTYMLVTYQELSQRTLL